MSKDEKIFLRLLTSAVAAWLHTIEFVHIPHEDTGSSMSYWPGDRLAGKLEELCTKITS